MVRRTRVANSSYWKSSAAKKLLAAADVDSVEAAISVLVARLIGETVCPPTDLDGLGMKLRVRSIITDSIPAAGELRRSQDGYIVVCAPDQPPGRRRFTIAHEFGHILLEECGARQNKDSPEIERLCDSIASEILMPEAVFIKESNGELTPTRVLEMARLFQASVIATARRCHTLRRASLFLTTGLDIQWGFGIVRPGPISNLDSDLRLSIEAAATGKAVSDLVFINTGSTSGQWKATSAVLGGTGSSLFLLRPVPRLSTPRTIGM